MTNRPIEVQTKTIMTETGCGKLYATISTEDFREVFLRLGKCGGCAMSFLDGVGRLISLASVPDEIIIKAFKGLRCPSPKISNGKEVLSCLDAVAKLLEATSPTSSASES